LTEIKKCFEIVLRNEILLCLSAKKMKNQEAKEDLQEGLNVLFDFLISLLARQNSVLRDITNIFFKAFSAQLSTASLKNMLRIVTTPNIDANSMLGGGDEEVEEDDGEESGEEEAEEEDSDLE
jgi:hypothetical protein